VHTLVPAVDILVNNAGVGLLGGIETTSLQDWDWLLATNLKGVIHSCHFFVPPMLRRAKGGHIVHLASALAYFAVPGALAYVTSKFALLGLSEALRAELEPQGIHLSVLCPGKVTTDLIAQAPLGHGQQLPFAARQRLQEQYQRQGIAPDVVAKAVLRAIEENLPFVPVGWEAQSLHTLQRWLPAVARQLGRRIRLFP
jgi:short-subunit dehydrogenase